MTTAADALTKDQLVVAMLALMGGEHREVNERDLFLACWHAFPNAMRWTDTALPNPDTFTASLRRLDASGAVQRVGKQNRNKRKRATRRSVIDAGRSGVVKARIKDGGLELAGVRPEDVALVRQLAPQPDSYASLDPALLVVICIGARHDENRSTDEGALVEATFHKFPAVFAYRPRPEFPDVETIKSAVGSAKARGLIADDYELTESGMGEYERYREALEVRVDASESYKTGALKLAGRIEVSAPFQQYRQTGTLTLTKGDELYRALRLPPTADPRPVAAALVARAQELRRVDKGELVEYLLRVAELHNPEVLELVSSEESLVTALAANNARAHREKK